MHTYKLYYFVNRGRAEAIRQVFHLSGTPFTNEILTAETWPPLKDEMPLYQVPVLEVDGHHKIGQSVAILRYLGNELGLSGKNHLENGRLDMIAEVIQEFNNDPGVGHWAYVLMGVDHQDKEDYFRLKVRPGIGKYAPLIEKMLMENGNNGLFLGDKETWVDVFAAESFGRLLDYGEESSLDAYPHIKAMITRVHNLPGIREHIHNREHTVC
ncbi:unnamed protein product, partial [Mesorhabditis belari]|uniref:Glutathione S-transferase n=1 Tax=Mesorhabditis belari TaxID=2138241 RepID=A0AAF3ENF8_9BILA